MEEGGGKVRRASCQFTISLRASDGWALGGGSVLAQVLDADFLSLALLLPCVCLRPRELLLVAGGAVVVALESRRWTERVDVEAVDVEAVEVEAEVQAEVEGEF